MRDFKGMKRQRGRNRKPGGGNTNANSANPNRSWDSQGPENIKVRGNAQTVYERYQQLARDAGSSGDRVLAENYMQHAEHYFRVLRALQPQRPVSEIAARELSNQGYDIDFEDETGAQAAAFVAAQAAADRAAQGGEARDNDGQTRDRDQNANRNDHQGQNREWRDRDTSDRDRAQNRESQNRDNPNRDRSQNRDRDAQAQDAQDRDGAPGDEPRADGESGRRETRRERWERRREERNRRSETEGDRPDTRADEDRPATAEAVAPEILVGGSHEPAADDVAPAAVERPRRGRATREPAEAGESPVGLPSFLTRSSAASPAPAPEEAEDPPVAPKRRAARRKAETPADGEG